MEHPPRPAPYDSCCPPDPKSVNLLRRIFADRLSETSDELADLFREAEPEVISRLNELVDVLKSGGMRPSSSTVLALFTMALALLLKEEYQPKQAMLVVDHLMPFADFVKDHLLSAVEDPAAGD